MEDKVSKTNAPYNSRQKRSTHTIISGMYMRLPNFHILRIGTCMWKTIDFLIQFNSILFNLLTNKNVQKFKKLVCTGKKQHVDAAHVEWVLNINIYNIIYACTRHDCLESPGY